MVNLLVMNVKFRVWMFLLIMRLMKRWLKISMMSMMFEMCMKI